MCGIAGAMSTVLNYTEVGYVKQLMTLACLRGFQGSGVMVARPEKKEIAVEYHRSELCAAEMVCDETFSSMLKHPKIIVAHARAPTRGDTTIENVHPHVVAEGMLLGVHNGTMTTVGKSYIKQNESDSRAVYEFLAKEGVEEFIKTSNGAYSLVWIDMRSKTLNFLRNDQRPMVMARIGNGNHAHTMYFASEAGMLKYILNDRGNISPNVTSIVSPKPWQHVEFPLDPGQGLFPTKLQQFDEPKFKTTGGWSGRGNFHEFWRQYEQEEAEATAKDAQTTSSEVIPIRPSLPVVYSSRTDSTTYGRHHGNRDILSGTNGDQSKALCNLPAVPPKIEEVFRRRGSGGPTTTNFRQRLLQRGSCVICEEQPDDVTSIHPVKFGDAGVVQYICDTCVQQKNPLALVVLGSSIEASSTPQ